MSQENVEGFERAVDAINCRDIDALLVELVPDVEWHDVFGLMLGGEATVYRGHNGVRDLFRDLYEAFAEIHGEYTEIRDLGDWIIAFGHLRALGNESGAAIESPLVTVVEYEDSKASRVRTFLDRNEALEAAGLRE